MNAFSKAVVTAMLAFAACGAAAQGASPAAMWGSAGHVTLKVSGAPAGFFANWQFDRADNGDIRIAKEEQRGDAKLSGTVMSFCDHHALLINGFVPVRRQALRELDDPILHLQLLLRLLMQSLPQGPLAIGAAQDVNFSGQKDPIRVRKGLSARRDFGTPWQVRGTVGRGPAGDIAFDLVFAYSNSESGGGKSELKLAGTWRQPSGMQKQSDTFAIADWQVYRVNTFATMVAGKTELDAEAATEPLPFTTLGELRARIERDWEENPKARKVMECK